MNQTRTFLMFAWLMVATLLWLAWSKDHEPATTTAVATPVATNALPGAAVPTLSVPTAPNASMSAAPAAGAPPPAMVAATPTTAATPLVTVSTDVLRLTLDGGAIHSADVLRYPQTTDPGSTPVRLFADDPAHFFEAQSGWVSSTGAAPSHESGFVPATPTRAFALGPGAPSLQVPFVWQGPNGVSIRRTYTFTRGEYVVAVRDDVVNTGSAPWQGYVYRQLLRVPPQVASGMMHPESYSFHGAAWFSAKDKLEKRKDAKFGDDAALSRPVTGGWIAMLQRHFFAAWIPGANDASCSMSSEPRGSASRLASRWSREDALGLTRSIGTPTWLSSLTA